MASAHGLAGYLDTELAKRDERGSKVLKSELVIDGVPKVLLATQVLFCRLDGNMPEEKLDLLQLPSSHVAELCTPTPQVGRCEPIDAGTLRRSLYDVPDGFR